MKAMVFAAGLGTRLRPITDTIPKALVEVGGTPMLGRVLTRLTEAGVTEAVVNIHHFPAAVREYLQGSDFGIPVHISDESAKLLDTGGGILAARKWLDRGDPFIVHNADILSDVNLRALAAEHVLTGADVTLLAQRRSSSRTFVYDSTARLRGWSTADGTKKIPANLDTAGLVPYAFGGISVVSPSVFPLLEKYSAAYGPVFSTTPFYASFADELNIRAWLQDSAYTWFDIGKPETLAAAKSWAKGQ